jgi:hypothetical protein
MGTVGKHRMSALEIALRYMEIFFSGRDLDRLDEVLHRALQFRGPFYQFDSAQEYIASLNADPPMDCGYEILCSFEKDDFVNLVYRFSKPGISTVMSQIFEVRDNKICSIELIFDSAAFRVND